MGRVKPPLTAQPKRKPVLACYTRSGEAFSELVERFFLGAGCGIFGVRQPFGAFFPRAQVALGHALRGEVPLRGVGGPSRAARAKCNFADECVPKCNLGTRKKPIPSARLAALIAVLESSPAAWFHAGPGETFHVSNSPNAPGQ